MLLLLPYSRHAPLFPTLLLRVVPPCACCRTVARSRKVAENRRTSFPRNATRDDSVLRSGEFSGFPFRWRFAVNPAKRKILFKRYFPAKYILGYSGHFRNNAVLLKICVQIGFYSYRARHTALLVKNNSWNIKKNYAHTCVLFWNLVSVEGEITKYVDVCTKYSIPRTRMFRARHATLPRFYSPLFRRTVYIVRIIEFDIATMADTISECEAHEVTFKRHGAPCGKKGWIEIEVKRDERDVWGKWGRGWGEWKNQTGHSTFVLYSEERDDRAGR